MKKSRRAPFVVTMALAAVGSGCGGSTNSDGTGGGGSGGSGGSPGGGGYGANPPGIPCPADLPAEGSACPSGSFWGNSCAFLDPCGGPDPFIAECSYETHQWHLLGSTDCACPASEPVVGAACSVGAGQWCSYPGCCPKEFQCIDDKWEMSNVSCNPPLLVCPDEPPESGTPCGDCTYGACHYECDAQAKSFDATCSGGTWQVQELPCVGVDAGAGGSGGT